MPCYGIDTTPIDDLMAQLAESNAEELFDVAIDQERHFEVDMRILEQYVLAFVCFLNVMDAVMRRKLEILNESHRYRYLGEFLPIYRRAVSRCEKLLLAWMRENFENPTARTQFVMEIVASGTADEMLVYTRTVPTAQDLDEVNSHGSTGNEVENSIKDLIRDKLGRGRIDRYLARGFQMLNEIIGIIFPGVK